MDVHDAGRLSAERFVRNLIEGTNRGGLVSALLWWAGDSSSPGQETRTGGAPVVLRMYRGNSWRAIEFSASDIDGCVEKLELLEKYEAEITQSLAEL
jgi:hypothetical protein